jgi:hypothetical protein
VLRIRALDGVHLFLRAKGPGEVVHDFGVKKSTTPFADILYERSGKPDQVLFGCSHKCKDHGGDHHAVFLAEITGDPP